MYAMQYVTHALFRPLHPVHEGKTVRKRIQSVKDDKITSSEKISLFVSQRSNNCPKQHRGSKPSNEELPNIPLSKPILTVKVVNIWTLQPIPGYCHNQFN
jgi:hypothetical protein